MATFLPERPFAGSPPSVEKVYSQLQGLPDDYTVWQCLPLAGAQFLIFSPTHTATLLSLTPSSGLLHADQKAPDAAAWPFSFPVRHLVLSSSTSPLSERPEQGDLHLIDIAGSADALLSSILAPTPARTPLGDHQLLSLRSYFTPEALLPPSLPPHSLTHDDEEPAPTFLDQHQERITKTDLGPPPSGDRPTKEAVFHLLTGPAGSGKSQVLIRRALNARQLSPTARILILTYNVPLRHQLQRHWRTLSPPDTLPAPPTWQSFLQWPDAHFPHPASEPPFDFIFIDEGQYFPSTALESVHRALASTGQLFLAADPTQGFQAQNQPWLSLGDLTRTFHLAHCYRATKQIAAFAQALLRAQTPSPFPPELDLPTREEISLLPNGELPHPVGTPSARATPQKVLDLLNYQLQQSPHLRGQILLLAHEEVEEDPDALFEFLETRLGAGSVHHLQAAQEAPRQPICRLSSLRAATGLEAPIVILLGADSLLPDEDGSDEEDPLEKATPPKASSPDSRLLYLALTRASSRLIIVTRDKHLWQAIPVHPLID